MIKVELCPVQGEHDLFNYCWQLLHALDLFVENGRLYKVNLHVKFHTCIVVSNSVSWCLPYLRVGIWQDGRARSFLGAFHSLASIYHSLFRVIIISIKTSFIKARNKTNVSVTHNIIFTQIPLGTYLVHRLNSVSVSTGYLSIQSFGVHPKPISMKKLSCVNLLRISTSASCSSDRKKR